MTVGGTALDIQGIKLDIADEDADYAEEIQLWDEGSAYLDGYTWLPGTDLEGGKAGWSQDWSTPSELPLTDSMNVVVVLPDDSEGGTLTIAGEVPAVTQTIPLHAGFNYVGNSTPATIDIQDLHLTIPDEEADYAEEIQIWDEGSAYVDGYTWLPGTDLEGGKAGWSQDWSTLSEFAIAPGQGVVIYMPDDYEGSDFVTIASPLPEAE